MPTGPAVAIIDDHPITGAGIAALLSQHGFTVVAVVMAVEKLSCAADVVVSDLRLPGRSGTEAIAYLAERGCRVIATSGVARREEILDVIAAGARGFVPKTGPAPVFVRAVSDVMRFSYFLSPDLAHLILADADLRPLAAGDLGDTERTVLALAEQGEDAGEVAASLHVPPEEFAGLLAPIWAAAVTRRSQFRPSPRERELMRLAAEGRTHKQAAASMSITAVTVSGYLKSVKSKYLATHPQVPEAIAPLTAARTWAQELGLG